MSSHAQVDKSRLALNTIFNSAAQLLSLVSVFLFTPLLVKNFGSLQFGLYTLAGSVVAYAALFDFGIGTALVRNIAKADALQDSEKIASDLKSAVLIYVGIGTIVALVMIVLGIFSESIFKVTAAEAFSLRWLLFISAGVQFFYWPMSVARHALAGFKRYGTIAISSLGQVIGSMVAITLTLYLGKGPVMLSLITGIALLAMSLRNVVALRSSLPKHVEASHITKSATTALLFSSMPLFALQISGMLMREQTDKVILGVMVGGVAITIYEIGAKGSFLISQFSALLTSAVLPIFSNLEALKQTDRIAQFYERGTRYIAIAVLPVGISLILVMESFITAWMGEGYETSILIARLLIASQLFMPLYLLGDMLLTAREKFSYWLKVSITLSVLNVILSIIFVKLYGVQGVAFGTFIANLLELPLLGRFTARESGLTVGRWLKSALLPALPLLVIPVILYLGFGYIGLLSSFFSVVVVFVMMVAAYWVAVYIIGLHQWERNQIKTFANRVLRRSL